MTMDTFVGKATELEISWGKEGKNRVIIPFEDFIDGELEGHERGGPNSGGEYDEAAIDCFRRMRKIIKNAMKHVRERNGKG
jgi:hypothetical protein